MPTATADPTLDLLRSFSEPGRYKVGPAVPIFKPHKRTVKREDGTEYIVNVTASDLPVIADNINRLLADHGVAQRMTVGHVNPKESEIDQPALVGYWKDATVGTFGPKQEPCVYLTPYFLPEHYAVAKRFPYRSAEYYPSRKEIRGVALLMRDPQLDLGMVVYDTDLGPCVLYSMNASNTDGQPTGHDDWLGHMTHYSKRNPWVGYAMQCYEGLTPMSQPATPANQAAPVMPLPGQEEAVRMHANEHAINYARLEQTFKEMQAENKALREQVDILRGQSRKDKAERIVTQLQAECYQLDRAEEVQAFVELDDAGWERYEARVRKNYQKAPVSYNRKEVPVYTGSVEGPAGEDETTREQMQAAVRYQKEHDGLTFNEALAAIKKK